MTDGVPPHTMTVSHAVAGLNYLSYKLHCDGVTDFCRTWQECAAPDCDEAALDRAEEDGDDRPEQHGVEHRHLDAGWSVPTDRCWLQEDPDWPAQAQELGLDVGVYRVVHTYTDGGEFYTLAVVPQ
jgi:hypothetical protein